jgi:beta-lactamase regulating signal transducer with metallopeptidase domain
LFPPAVRTDSPDFHPKSREPNGWHCLNPKTGLLIQGVPVRFAEEQQTPAVDGLIRPSISLPSGIDQLLNEDELGAVLLHELKHAKRRDI